MYRIAICDDEPAELKKIETLLESYKLTHPDCDFTVQKFISVDELLNEIAYTYYFDLLLLDIYLPNKTGIEGAREMRKEGVNCPIIFLTYSIEHAVDAFDVSAVQYIIKPLEQARFFDAIDKAFEHVQKQRSRCIVMRLEGEFNRIELNDIVYCESHGNYQYIVLVGDKEIKVRMTLMELQNLVGISSDFVRVGRAYLVNLGHVDSMSTREILLDNNRKIGVPRGAYLGLKEQYFKFYCNDNSSGNIAF